MEEKPYRSGFVTIVGRPNAGKSTLLNALLGQKIAIVTKKPQTTRNRIIGIKTLEAAQIVLMDTPGIHKPHNRLDEVMMREARDAMQEVDALLFMVEPGRPGPREKEIIELIGRAGEKKAVFLLINKVDTIKKVKLLPVIDEYSKLFRFDQIIPISALKGDGVDLLLEKLLPYLPEGPKYYPEDLVTDQVERFMVSEIIREKVMEATFDEVPHAVAVEVVNWQEGGQPQGSQLPDQPQEGQSPEDYGIAAAGEAAGGLIRISADIWVEHEGQKGIIIGKSGRMLKEIGTAARLDIEKLLNARVYLQLWVKLKRDWREDARSIRELGFNLDQEKRR
ncbi:MAG: GTPase Era [Nitrospiraceae bacterium]|nr:GTPase Era [Nitrospiraceae bacterium]